MKQENMIKRFTQINKGKLNLLEEYKNYKVEVKFCSWKDGSVDAIITDGNITIETELISLEEMEIKNRVCSVVKKLLRDKCKKDVAPISNKTLNELVKDSVAFASKLKGAMTHDFNKHDCHSRIYLTL